MMDVRTSRWLNAGVLVLTLMSVSAASVSAQDGVLNLTFGDGGIARTGIFGDIRSDVDVVVQADSKLVLASKQGSSPDSHYLARFDTCGRLDPSFGTGGIVQTGFMGEPRSGVSVAVQEDGKLILASMQSSSGHHYLARFDTDGLLDLGFGTGGITLTGFECSRSAGVGVVVQADGKLVLAGHQLSSRNHYLARFDTDGTLDPGFGAGGIALTGFDGGSDGLDLALQADGSLVLAGLQSSSQNHFLARFDMDGILDPGFGTDGIALTGFEGNDADVSVAVQADGKLVLASHQRSSFNHFLARFDTGGSLDPTFGTSGIAVTGFDGDGDGVGVAVQAGGEIVLAGLQDRSPRNHYLARFDTAGSRDPGFGTDGIALSGLEGSNGAGVGVAVEVGGELVLASLQSGPPSNHYLAWFGPIGDLDLDCIADQGDNCPAVSNFAQEDQDADGSGDVCDCCPEDPGKTRSGACGCGVADVDSDSDGDTVLDCLDSCPLDGAKVEAGTCGCGVADVDSDGDAVLDCLDLCPLDGTKVHPGTCGCGLSDGDLDGDGLSDCLDLTLVRCEDCDFRSLLAAALPSLPEDPDCSLLPASPVACCPLVEEAVGALTDDVLPSTHPCAAPCGEECRGHDFDGLEPGTMVEAQFSGLTVSGTTPVLSFDSSNPTCDDEDLATPGLGSGNDLPRGDVLVLSEPGSSCVPDDARDGGVMTFEYDTVQEVHWVGLLDVDEEGTAVRAFDSAGELLLEVPVPSKTDNSWQRVDIARCGVKLVEIESAGSFAVTDLACESELRRSRRDEGVEGPVRARSRRLSGRRQR
ncbi:MAG: hypothetical protein AAF533_21850 [Acidobacteriota bacterium]